MAKVWSGHSFGLSNQKSDPKATPDFSVTNSIDTDLTGATRRDRTGDLLITKFCFVPYAIESTIGLSLETSAYSACPWRIAKLA